MRFRFWAGWLTVFSVVGLVAFVFVSGQGWLARPMSAGEPAQVPRSQASAADSRAAQQQAAEPLEESSTKQILFGDFHVHTSFSQDAFTMGMPLSGGSGSHTVADACDFARFCSSLDFWSVNDHAESSTPRRWQETADAIRSCNAVSESASGEPDLISFLGWEWSHMGTTAENHFGHRNVILRDLEPDRIPTRPIASDSPADYFQAQSTVALGLLPLIARDANYFRYSTYTQETTKTPRCPDGEPVRSLPSDCREYAATPGELFSKLDDWGFASLVIPHGTTWGMYTPKGSEWKKQLTRRDHDPLRQRLVEVYSGHGNTEAYRDWRAVDIAADGSRHCPAPRDDYMPSCFRAGEIIRSRCREAGEAEATCDARAAEVRQYYADAPSGLGHLSVPAGTADDWKDAGQCRDCFLPAFNFRPGSSVQSMLARGAPSDSGEDLRFRFGFIGSSDTHTARPGSGYKDALRTRMSDARMARVDLPVPSAPEEPAPQGRVADPTSVEASGWIERDRAGSFYYTGGLVAAHAATRSREGIWDALEQRETYATSGPRILLWFDLLNDPSKVGASDPVGAEDPADPKAASGGRLPMGGVAKLGEAPIFEVRAAGSRVQKPGCSSEALAALGPARLDRLCGGECFNPSDARRRITRIEVIRIRPQVDSDEPLRELIEDPWKTLDCDRAGEGMGLGETGCRVRFSDPEFAFDRRDTVYYVRALEEPSLAVNGGSLGCSGEDCETQRRCDPWSPEGEDCLAEVEERAWSSPIFVDFEAGASLAASANSAAPERK